MGGGDEQPAGGGAVAGGNSVVSGAWAIDGEIRLDSVRFGVAGIPPGAFCQTDGGRGARDRGDSGDWIHAETLAAGDGRIAAVVFGGGSFRVDGASIATGIQDLGLRAADRGSGRAG